MAIAEGLVSMWIASSSKYLFLLLRWTVNRSSFHFSFSHTMEIVAVSPQDAWADCSRMNVHSVARGYSPKDINFWFYKYPFIFVFVEGVCVCYLCTSEAGGFYEMPSSWPFTLSFETSPSRKSEDTNSARLASQWALPCVSSLRAFMFT